MKKIPFTFLIGVLFLTTVIISQTNDGGQKKEPSKMIRVPDEARKQEAQDKSASPQPRADIIPQALVQLDSRGRAVQVNGEVDVADVKTAREAADKFLADNADKFKIEQLVRSRDNSTGLRVKDEIKSLTGTHLTYQQFYDNLPVFEEELKVSVNQKLQVINASNTVVVVKSDRGVEKGGGNQDSAVAAALKAVNHKIHPKVQPIAEAGFIRDSEGNPTRVFRVSFQTVGPAGAWEVLVKAANNEIIRVEETGVYANGKGKIFRPNPVVSSGKFNFLDDNDADSAFLTSQLFSVKLEHLDGNGNLDGKFANTGLTWTFERARDPKLRFNYTRADDRFEEVMAYYWVTEATKRLHKIGYPNVLNRSIPIDVNYLVEENGKMVEEFNAFYFRANKSLNFGTGGVDTAEDATVILHEYGHALLDAQVPGFGRRGGEAAAINEAFGDYWSASFLSSYGGNKGKWNIYLGSWWAAGIPVNWGLTCSKPGEPPCLRRLDGMKHYPEDMTYEEHDDGEIWSACLWQIWMLLGKDKADKLILEANFRLPIQAKFKDAANAIIATNRDLNKGKKEAELRKIFTDRGILSATQ